MLFPKLDVASSSPVARSKFSPHNRRVHFRESLKKPI